MDNIRYHLVWFILVFLFIFIIYFILLSRKLKKRKKNIGEIVYLIHRFSLDQKKLNFSHLKWGISIINAFIISFVSCFIMMIPVAMMVRFLIGFVLLFALIYALYEIYGRMLKRKYGKD